MSHDASLGGGVASPTRYTIIHHFPVVWSDEHFAKLTHYLTCEYPNWPGSLNVPCPLMLSSKLAEITRTKYGSQNPSDNLEDYLHYIYISYCSIFINYYSKIEIYLLFTILL